MSNAIEEFSHFFEVKLDLFDGPIDLLLHLVKQRELPIEKVSLAVVANQYLSCIEQLKRFDLEIAGEYLVIAATLLSIKSSVLLGEPANLVEDEEGNLVDPHQELLRRLREAEVYKEGAFQLSTRALLGHDVFQGPNLLKHFEAPGEVFVDHSPMLLAKAFRKLLENAGPELTFNISYDPVSIVQRMMDVLAVLKQAASPMAFYKLVPDVTNRGSIISTFIALLELCKRQVIEVSQDGHGQEILINLQGAEVDSQTLSSEFDGVSGQGAQNGDALANG